MSRGSRGSAVVGFALVVVPLVALLLATAQAIAYLRVRGIVAAAAQTGARAAAAASTQDGGAVADAVLRRSVPAADVRCAADVDGALVEVRCDGRIPSILPLPHAFLPLHTTAHASREPS